MTSQVAQYGQFEGHAAYGGQHSHNNYNQSMSDEEAEEVESSEAESSDIPKGLPLDGSTPDYIRVGFVRKVYSLLSMQLALTFVIGFFVTRVVQDNTVLSVPLYYSSLIITMGTLCAVTCCCKNVVRTFPYNYLFLFLLTLGMSVMAGIATVGYSGPSVMMAVATTAVVFTCLTAYACCSTTDWTGMGPYLFAGLISMIGFACMMQLFCMFGMCPGTFTQKILSGLGVLLFAMYIIYDTQLIIGGNHKNQFSIDDYVFAALILYLDIINLFLHILALFGNRSS